MADIKNLPDDDVLFLYQFAKRNDMNLCDVLKVEPEVANQRLQEIAKKKRKTIDEILEDEPKA